jgi:UDP-glucose 6-dehydrogenase
VPSPRPSSSSPPSPSARPSASRSGSAIVGDLPFHVADNPEFLKEGDAIRTSTSPTASSWASNPTEVGDQFRDLYDPFVRNGHPIYIMDVPSAEMVKYASNNFLATKISFINEMANLCEAYGANINQVREGMCADKRIGTSSSTRASATAARASPRTPSPAS